MEKFIWCIIVLIYNLHGSDAKSNRNMIILLEQTDKIENIGSTSYALSHKLESILQEQASPILISASLLNTFLEKRRSIQQISFIPNTQEQEILKTYNNINSSLNESYIKFNKLTNNPTQAQQLMLEEVNNKFYTKDAIYKNDNFKELDRKVHLYLQSYLIKFNIEDWDIYTNQKSFYLLLPKKYHQSLQKKEEYQATDKLSKEEILLGLKVDHLTRVNNINDTVDLYFDSQLTSCTKFVDHLSDFFVTQKDYKEKLPYAWNIFLNGHGGMRYSEDTDSYLNPVIADLLISEFHKLLDFLDLEICTRILHYSTCFGGGKRIKMLFKEEYNKKYNYAILCSCLTDGYSFSKSCSIKLPSKNYQNLTLNDIVEEDGVWLLKSMNDFRWAKYFKEISKVNFNNSLYSLPQICSNIIFGAITNNGILRLPMSLEFFVLLREYAVIINDTFLDNIKDNLVLKDKCTILLDSNIINKPINIESYGSSSRILSLQPGHSKNYLKEIVFNKTQDILNSFASIDGDRFQRKFIIDKVTIPNTSIKSFKELLGVQNDKLELLNVYIHTQDDRRIRVFFQLSEDRAFMLLGAKSESWDNNVQIKGIYPLSTSTMYRYLDIYQDIKKELGLLNK